MSKAFTDQSLGRMSAWASLAVLAGVAALPFLPAHDANRRALSVDPPAVGRKPAVDGGAAALSGNDHGHAPQTRARRVASAASRMLPSVPSVADRPPAGDAAGTVPADGVEDIWAEGDIAAGLRECVRLLARVKADLAFRPPIKKGQCGSPAPLQIQAFGSATKVELRPSPTMNCRLAARLYEWVEKTVQPAARELLGSPIVRIVGTSSYACRNVYNLPDRALSEHATGNAIDITGFVTADGRTIMVVHDWGPTKRDIAEARKKRLAEAKKAAAKKDTNAETKADRVTPSIAKAASKADTRAKGLVHKAGLTTDAVPPASAERSTPRVSASKRIEAAFLKQLHQGGCGVFATVLGPEANEAHRNHFHFDMKKRRSRGYCR